MEINELFHVNYSSSCINNILSVIKNLIYNCTKYIYIIENCLYIDIKKYPVLYLGPIFLKHVINII